MYRLLFFGMLLATFLLSTTGQAQPAGNPGSHDESSVAIVNGKPIPFTRYRQSLADQVRSPQNEVNSVDQTVDDAVMLELVDEELTVQEAAKFGIEITRDQALEFFIANPPDYVKDVFVGPDGTFDRITFEQVVRNPKLIADIVAPGAPTDEVIEQWKTDIEKVIRYFQYDETRRRLMDSLYAQAPFSQDDIKHRYFAENTVIDGSFVRVMHTTIPEEEVSVSDAEARNWYDTHGEEYRIPPSRSIQSIIFPILPSPADSTAWLLKIDSIESLIKGTPWEKRTAMVEEIIKTELPPSRIPEGRVISLKELPRNVSQELAKSNQGDIVGPYPVEDESLFFYVEGVVPSNDTLVHARHILISVPKDGGPEEDASSRDLAQRIRDNTTTEEDFIEAAKVYSYDASAEEGGDIGYIRRDDVVPEFSKAAFSTEIGEFVGPVKTAFGYHLIYIKDRITRSYYLRELRFPIAPSPSVRTKTISDAQHLTELMWKGALTDSILTTYKAMYRGLVTDTSLITRLEPYGDALIPGEFAFSAEEGDAGMFMLPYNRVMAVQLLRIWSHGLPDYEEIEIYPRSHALRKKQMDKLEPLAKRITDSMTTDMLLGPLRDLAKVSHVFLLQNQSITDPPEEEKYLLDSLAMVTDDGEVTGPVRGVHGYYYLRVTSKEGPTEQDYLRDREAFTKDFMSRYREELYENRIRKARSYSEIQDLRPSVQSILSSAQN